MFPKFYGKRRPTHKRRPTGRFRKSSSHTRKTSKKTFKKTVPSGNAFNFYSNPHEKKMKWIDFVKQIHNKNRQKDPSTPLSVSLKEASAHWKKR